MEALEVAQRRVPNAGDISDVERKDIEFEEAADEHIVKECFLRVVVRLGARFKIEVPVYEINLDAE
jgi:hypothetical protein